MHSFVLSVYLWSTSSTHQQITESIGELTLNIGFVWNTSWTMDSDSLEVRQRWLVASIASK